jgi:hypothetical protein
MYKYSILDNNTINSPIMEEYYNKLNQFIEYIQSDSPNCADVVIGNADLLTGGNLLQISILVSSAKCLDLAFRASFSRTFPVPVRGHKPLVFQICFA